MIVHITNDLMMSGTVRSEAATSNAAVRFVQSSAQIEEALATQSVRLIFVDLQMPGLDLAAFSREILAIDASSRPEIVMYAQHVNVEVLENARQSELGEVMTRGQFVKSVRQILADHTHKTADRSAE